MIDLKEIGYMFAKTKGKLSKNHKETISRYFRKSGMKIGKNCNICCNIMTPEPYLIEIGDDVTVAGYVHFITHDNSISKVLPNRSDFFGRVKIGNKCFIGQGSLILPGIELAPCIIVAAGSVVTKSFDQSGIIIGGNPAKIIGTWTDLAEKWEDLAIDVKGMTPEHKRDYILTSKRFIHKRKGK